MNIDRDGELQRPRPRPTGWAAAVLLFWALLLGGVGCVQTAECNESTGCPESEVCYRFSCRAICQTDASCGGGMTCRPCQDPDEDTNHCFGRRVRACVPVDSG
jgi:hypothetical protein